MTSKSFMVASSLVIAVGCLVCIIRLNSTKPLVIPPMPPAARTFNPIGSAAAFVAAAEAAATEPCPVEANLAVLNKLNPILGGGYSSNPTKANLDAQDSKITCIREWAMTIGNPCVRAEYESWLDFYAGESKRQREELEKVGTVESDADKFNREYAEKQAKVRAYERAHPVPKPPSCERELIRSVR